MKFTLVGLVVLLVVIIATSYVMNQEGFQTIVPSRVASPAVVSPPAVAPSVATPATVSPVMAPTAPKASLSAPAANVMVPPSSEKVEVSPSGYDAMTKNQRASLLRDIQKVVRNELISKRALEHVKDQEDDYDDEDESDSTAQGRDYKKNSFKSEDACSADSKCDPLVDMTKYIRKDQIPCWGCNIDY